MSWVHFYGTKVQSISTSDLLIAIERNHKGWERQTTEQNYRALRAHGIVHLMPTLRRRLKGGGPPCRLGGIEAERGWLGGIERNHMIRPSHLAKFSE
jgi:hypothetical protein